MNILSDQYGIKFLIKVIHNKPHKTLSSEHPVFSDFLGEWRTAREIDELLLFIIDGVLNNVVVYDKAQSSMVVVDVFPNESKFCYFDEYDGANYDLIIPTDDLRTIIVEWKNFLIT